MTHLILDNSSPWTQGITANLILLLATVRLRANVKIKFKEIMNIFKKSKVTVHSESLPPFPKPSGPSMSTTREISLCPISPFSSIPLATSSYPYLTSPPSLPQPLLCLLCVFLCPLLKKANISLLLRLGKKVVSYQQICS